MSCVSVKQYGESYLVKSYSETVGPVSKKEAEVLQEIADFVSGVQYAQTVSHLEDPLEAASALLRTLRKLGVITILE